MTALTVAPTWIQADLSDAIEKNTVKIVGTILHARSRRSNSGGQVEEYVDDIVWYVCTRTWRNLASYLQTPWLVFE